MGTTMIRAQLKPECAAEAEQQIGRMFEAVAAAGPDGVRYASARVDASTYVVLLSLESERNPLTEIPEFLAFQSALPQWLAAPPAVEQLDVVGSYRVF